MGKTAKLLALLVSIFAATALAACTQEVVREVPVTEVVTQEVIREVPVEKIVEVERETVRTIEVEKPVEVVKEVVKEVQVPGETVVVEKEVVREVMVPGQTVVVEKEVVREVPRDVVVTKEVVREVEKIVEVDPRMGGTLRYASGVGLKFLDSQHTTAGVTADANQMAYEGLFHSDLEEIQQPMLVDNFAITDGGLKWTLKLREGINFHNGEPLTAQDIIGSFTRVWDKASQWRSVRESFIDSFEAADDNTLVLQLKKPTQAVMIALSRNQPFPPYAIPKSIWSLPQSEPAQEVIGTGPYMFEEWRIGDRWSLVRYDDYKPSSLPTSGMAGRHVAFADRVVWIEIPDDASQVAALETGQVDIIPQAPGDFVDRLLKNRDIQVVGEPERNLIGVWLNNIRPPFDDVRARRAVLMAYPATDAMFAAFGPPISWTTSGSIFYCFSEWATELGAEDYDSRNVEGARALIEEAGLTGTEVTMMVSTSHPPMEAAGRIFKDMLEEIGLVPDYQAQEWASLVSKRGDPDKWDLFTTWSAIGTAWGGGTAAHLKKEGWFHNYQDPDGVFSSLIEQAWEATSFEDQKRIHDEIQVRFYQEVPFLPIGWFGFSSAARKEVKGYGADVVADLGFDIWLERN